MREFDSPCWHVKEEEWKELSKPISNEEFAERVRAAMQKHGDELKLITTDYLRLI